MENIFVEFLPPWVETGIQPAFYDKESGTVLQQTARMYARVNMLIRMFNKLSKQTKETVDHYIEEFTTLYNYVHDYFDNLDVQEEINNKLDVMASDGTLEEIMADYIRTKAVWCFDTVADMKSSTNLDDGSFAETLGYHTKNDGGSAVYKIRSISDDDVVDESFIIAIGDTLVAELIYNDIINVKQLGAYGDNTHNDSSIIQKAFDVEGNVYIPNGVYLLNTGINITNRINEKKAFVINADEAEIVYTGNQYAFDVTKTSNALFNIGSIIATTGGCIKFHSSGVTDFVQHITINFKVMQGGNTADAVYGETTGDGWVNEIHLNDGTFYRDGNVTAENCVHIGYGCNNWNFNRLSLVGATTGVKLENSNTEHSMGHYTFNQCRYAESVTNFIVGAGWVRDVIINDTGETQFYRIVTDTDCNNWYVYSTNSMGSRLVQGVWQFAKNVKTLEGGTNIPNDSNFNDYTTPGDYNVNQQSAINSASNRPMTKTIGKLTVQTFNNFRYTTCPYILQTYTTVYGAVFNRAFDGTNWQKWNMINQCADLLLPENSDMNSFMTGSFYCDNGTLKATLTNLPAGCGNIFRMDVKRIGGPTSGDSRLQVIYDTDGHIFTRASYGSAYTAWKTVSLV